jgi:hypothetical protein
MQSLRLVLAVAATALAVPFAAAAQSLDDVKELPRDKRGRGQP